jgi:putative ABC transport system ATP-binding protein
MKKRWIMKRKGQTRPEEPRTLQLQAPVIAIQNLTKVYKMGETEVHALRGVSLTIEEGEYVAIIGTSGSGKSTLMNMIGLLDKPTNGQYAIRGMETSQLSQDRMADMRNQEIGFVFQRFNLLARTNARRQVELPLFYAGIAAGKASKMAVEALERVGLGDRTHHRPDELSGGQQQRVAIARALVNRPSILLADEPTGALDTKTGEEVMALFEELHQQGMTLIVVTHDNDIAAQAQRIVTLRDGQIISDVRNETYGEKQTNGVSWPTPETTVPPVGSNGRVTAAPQAPVQPQPPAAVIGEQHNEGN